jgi:hypothetical protein
MVVMSGGAGGAAGCDTDISEDFTGANLNAWTMRVGTWVLDAGNDNMDSAGVTDQHITHDTSLGTIQHWAKMKLVQSQYYPGVVLRYDSGNTYYYAVTAHHSNGNGVVRIRNVSDGSQADASMTFGPVTVSNGDTWAASVEGTGNDTIFRVWQNPSGGCPSEWGAADWTITDNPSNPADSGNQVGVMVHGNYTITVDDFSAGDW